MKERIQKILGNAGIDSRRNIEAMVRDGRIAINGVIKRDLPILVDPEKETIEVDGERIRVSPTRGKAVDEERVYVLMNKPKGVYTTNVAQGVQRLAIDLLPDDFPRVYPVGRLDAESQGLLLLTNDGDLTNKLTHPRYGVPKTYRATVDGSLDEDLIAALERGIWLTDREGGVGFKTGRSHIKVVHRERDRTILDITIRESRNRQVRRMLAKLGHKVRDLTRVKIGPLTLDRLPPGKYRPLTPREIRELRQYADHKEKNPDHEPRERQERRRAFGAAPAAPRRAPAGDDGPQSAARPKPKAGPPRVRREHEGARKIQQGGRRPPAGGGPRAGKKPSGPRR